jgi:tetratricopeptide (TPR) repeat protein
VGADVHVFAAALERGQPEAAVQLYGGPFLAGVNLVNLQSWENWVEGRRMQYARAFRKACRDWLESRRAALDLQGAIEAAQRWVVTDPLDDEAQHRLIAALADAGERTAAIRQYEAYARLLQAEDLHALDETIALIERVRSEATVGPAITPAAHTVGAARSNPQSAAEPSASSTKASAMPGPRLPLRSLLRRRAIVAAAAVLLLIMAMAWGINRMRSEPSAALSAASIAVLPFSVRGDEDAAYLAEGMVNLLGTALDGVSVRPTDARAVFAVVSQDGGERPGLDLGSRVAARLGAGLFVLGDVIQAGSQLRIEASVYRAGGAPEPLSRGTVSGGAEHVFELVDQLAAQLLAGLGAAPGDRLTRTAAVTTTSLAAFKAYLQGEADIRAGRFERAEEAYLRAIAHDSTFAIAHYRRALALDWGAGGDPEEAARAAARHAERLTPRDRALLEAHRAYSVGDAPDAERRYRAILARYPDDLEAWLQLAEVLFHFGPVRGRATSESGEAWRRVLSYEPKNVAAIVHLARIASADGRSATLDSLIAPFASTELTTDRRLLQVAAFRAIASGDTATVRTLVQSVRSWEDAAAWQLAAYLTAFSDVPERARPVLQELIGPQRAAGTIADLHWFVALLHLENGQLAAARGAMTDALAANAVVPAVWHRRTFELITDWWSAALPLPAPDSTLDRIRHTASSSNVSLPSGKSNFESSASGEPLWIALTRQALGNPNRFEALRLYTVGTVSLRLSDRASASTASAALARLAASNASDWFVHALDGELRARRAWHDGRPEQALTILDQVELGPVSVGATNIVPFLAHAQRRYLRGQLLSAVGRDAEALQWFASLGALSVPETPFRALAHLRQAEIHERLGNRSEAVTHYSRFVALWQNSDPELQPLVEAARDHRATAAHSARKSSRQQSRR